METARLLRREVRRVGFYVLAILGLYTLFGAGFVVYSIWRAPDFGGETESTALSYKQYADQELTAWFDPNGARDIYYRCCSTRDGYDAWWRFAIAPDDYRNLLTRIIRANNGPDPIVESNQAAIPSAWRPQGQTPEWWTRGKGKDSKSIVWCYKKSHSDRHHGWYLMYDPDSRSAWIWHWNHQWSSDQCSQEVGV